uniref:Uncharacterized protein n=1 Tax=Schizaphis graminum TaxID=13262 RepID=A0A2S2PGW0_SCHGA
MLLYLCNRHRCVANNAARGSNVFIAGKTTIRTEIPICAPVCIAIGHDKTILIGPVQTPEWATRRRHCIVQVHGVLCARLICVAASVMSVRKCAVSERPNFISQIKRS